jgi:hypothetical protein
VNNFIEVAKVLARGHWNYCEDSWYSCPLAMDGCADESQKECTCGYEQRVKEIYRALESAYEQGHEAGMSKAWDIINENSFMEGKG